MARWPCCSLTLNKKTDYLPSHRHPGRCTWPLSSQQNVFHSSSMCLWTQTRMPSSAKGRAQLSKVTCKGWGEKPGIPPCGNSLGEGGCSLKCFSHSNPQKPSSAFLAPFYFCVDFLAVMVIPFSIPRQPPLPP